MLAVWWAWIDTAWITNWLDPERSAVRLLLFGLMLAGIGAFGVDPQGIRGSRHGFRGVFAAMQIGRSLFMLWAMKNHDAGNFRNFVRIIVWQAVAACSGCAGAWPKVLPG